MDYQAAFNIAIGIAAASGGWMLRSISNSLENLQRDHKEIFRQFVRKDDYRDALERIEVAIVNLLGSLPTSQGGYPLWQKLKAQVEAQMPKADAPKDVAL